VPVQKLTQPLVLRPHVPLPDGLPAFLRLVAEPNRLRILALLARREHCVCDIEAALDLPQNLVSHHLAALRRAGVVRDRREGRWVYYALDSAQLAPHLTALTRLLDASHAYEAAPACQEDET
jgi:ArsR family transcriptional regulator, arsenate/arsenite/antimonite-responsive transcriptional repressor